MNMGAQAGGALTASLTPWIAARYGWTASFMVAASLCAAGAVGLVPGESGFEQSRCRNSGVIGMKLKSHFDAVRGIFLLCAGRAGSSEGRGPDNSRGRHSRTRDQLFRSRRRAGKLNRRAVAFRNRQSLHAAHYSGIAWALDGDRSAIATTPNFAWPRGIGPRTERGAMPPASAATSPAAPELKEPIRYILPYALPHRGFSTSGDRPITGPNLTYWKSNPYLTSKFTGESDALHPQWVVVDLKSQKSVNAIRIAWAAPFATTYRVEYWVGKDPLEFDKGPEGEWKTFDSGSQKNATGGTVTLRLGSSPVTAQYFRIWMTASSNTCDEHGSGDIRNCVGYAIKEIELGTVDANSEFKGAAQDATEQQKFTYCSSSIDPWHSADDVNRSGMGQHSGFDLFYTSGITNGLPARIPVTMLYGTPDDAAAQIAYIEKRGYPIAGIELGEEPDGKHASAGRLRCPVHPMGNRHPQNRSQTETGRTDFRRGQRRHHRLARRSRPKVLDGSLRRLPQVARPLTGLGLRLVRTLPLRAVHDHLEVAVSGTTADETYFAGLARRWRAQRRPSDDHGGPPGRRADWPDEHDFLGIVARRQRRLVLRRRWRGLLPFADPTGSSS